MTEQTAGWERLAVRTGGTVAALAATLADGAPLVFAATPAGVHRSLDVGRTWTLAGSGGTVPFAEAVAVSPGFARDCTLFVGAGDGLYRSRDGGESWERVLVGSRVTSLAAAPEQGGRDVWLVGTETDGILRSEDAGRTWTGANAGLVDLTVLALALSPRFEEDGLGFAGTASGLYRTRNRARSWRACETVLEEPAVQCLAISPGFADDRLILAGTEGHGLLRSTDAGTTWEAVPAMGEQGVAALALSARRAGQPTIAAGTQEGVAISHDGGRTWRTTGPDLGPVLSLLFVRRGDREVLLAGLAGQGAACSEDDGVTWTRANAGLSASVFLGLALSPDFAQDRTLFASSLQRGVSVSTDGGQTWEDRNDGLEGGSVFGLAVSGNYGRDHTVYAATADGLYRSRDGAASWHRLPGPTDPARVVATGPGAAGPTPVLAALAGGRLLGSDDAGATWRRLGDGFDGAEIVSLALSPTYARDRTIFVGTTSRPAAEMTGDLVLWRSIDSGAHWQRWLVERGAGVLPLVVPPSYAVDELLFVGLDSRVLRPLRHAQEVRRGERRPIWQSAELGGGSALVTALTVSPSYASDRTVFAATSAGVFVSRDGGGIFRPWSEGLSPLSLVALATSPNYASDRLVYALGLGGTVWRRASLPT